MSCSTARTGWVASSVIGGVAVPVLALRQDLVGVVRRWIGKPPLQCLGVLTPVGRFFDALARQQGIEHDANEEDE